MPFRRGDASHPSFCHLCGNSLHGRYLTYENGLVVCERCEATVPRCSRCNMPSRQLTLVRGVPVCPTCLKQLPVCQSCHIPITGKYYKIGDSPLPYCETCVSTRPRCDLCRVPLDEKGRIFPGKDSPVHRCGECLRSAVKTAAAAEQIYHETNALLMRELALNVAPLPALHVVERANLLALNKQTGELEGIDAPIGPEHQHLLGFFKRVNGRRDIYIEQLLPATLFRAVAAHELAHAWQSANAPASQPPMIVEGFAEWAAYRTLLALGEQQDAARLTRRDDLYGQGLRYFISLEQQHGREGVLRRASLP